MKDGRFETHVEIYKHLLDGGRVRRDAWEHDFIVIGKDGVLVNMYGDIRTQSFNPPGEWLPVQEPKKLYAYKKRVSGLAGPSHPQIDVHGVQVVFMTDINLDEIAIEGREHTRAPEYDMEIK